MKTDIETLKLDLDQAEKLITLPLGCIQKEYPNKLNQSINSKEDIGEPAVLHPAFYGCFDWHSSVHGHWTIVKLLKEFPLISKRDEALLLLQENLSEKNIAQEVKYFDSDKHFERTYGWAWLLKLVTELHSWDHEIARKLESNIQPLTDTIVAKYLDFLPKLVYPVRVGTHTNTAFGLVFAWDYAQTVDNEQLKSLIKSRAKEFYFNDKNCPMSWEPSGYDFLSPCFEEIDIMRRVLSEIEFNLWIKDFLPELHSEDYDLEPAIVSDRNDGHLVHLDGLNFSRAWVILGLVNQYREFSYLRPVANEHIKYSLPNLLGDSYEGGHWLGSFAIYALSQSED